MNIKWGQYNLSDNYNLLWDLLQEDIICFNGNEHETNLKFQSPNIMWKLLDGTVGMSPANFNFPMNINNKEDFLKACNKFKIYFIPVN
jgi:hypothetical protein